jgi:hypothetical protein
MAYLDTLHDAFLALARVRIESGGLLYELDARVVNDRQEAIGAGQSAEHNMNVGGKR